MITPVPPTILHAGRVFLPDIDPPWPAKLLMLWVLLGPMILFVGVRRGRTGKTALTYVLSSCLAIVAMNMLTWGWPSSRTLAEGFMSWCWWLTYPALVLGGTLAVLALGAGYVSIWFWRPRGRIGPRFPNR